MAKKKDKSAPQPRSSSDGTMKVQRTFWLPLAWIEEVKAGLLIELPDGSRESLTAFARAAWKNEMERRKKGGRKR